LTDRLTNIISLRAVKVIMSLYQIHKRELFVTSDKYVAAAFLSFLALMGAGCALWSVFPKDSSAVAVVNDCEISVDAFHERTRNIHRAKSMAPSEGVPPEIDIEGIVREMINDRLIIQEAYRVSLDEDPLFADRINRHITNSSVARLRKEEVIDKIMAGDKAIREYFDTHYEEIRVRQIFSKDRKKAEDALMLLKDGEAFSEVAKSKSEWQGKGGSDLGFIKRGKMEDAFDEAAFALKKGETSDIVQTSTGFHIIKMEERRAASDEMFEARKKKIRKKLLREKEKKRSDDYVADLKTRADIRIDTELLYSLDAAGETDDTDAVVARVNGAPISVGEVIQEIGQKSSHGRRSQCKRQQESKEVNQEAIDRLMLYLLVQQEAKKKNYMDDALFAEAVRKYKDSLLLNFYKEKIVLPRAIPTEEELSRYYETHKDNFRKDHEVCFSKMLFSSLDTAEEALRELNKGADFEFLASEKAFGSPGRRANVWVPLGRLSPEIREGIKDLAVGGISNVICEESKYSIIKLKGKRGGEPEEFARVSDVVKQVVVKENFDKWLQEYLNELRKVSAIHINKRLLNELAASPE